MAARTPRRSFAAPFVVTLATIPGCYVQSTPPAQNPPPVAPAPTATPPPAMTEPGTAPVANPPPPGTPNRPDPIGANAPAPTGTGTVGPQKPTSATPNRWAVTKTGATCEAREIVSCPSGAICNPPPPFPYACPTSATIGATGITVAANPDGKSCFIEPPPMNCPPNVACNPPRPQPVSCPVRPSR